MSSKIISISAINHHPRWDTDPYEPPIPTEFAKYNVHCLIYYDPKVPPDNNPKLMTLWDKVAFREDRTEDFEVPDGDARGVEFFWEEVIGGQRCRRMAWYDRERTDYGKSWGWLGMFWLFDSFKKDAAYERLACGIARKKFTPPWPSPGFRK